MQRVPPWPNPTNDLVNHIKQLPGVRSQAGSSVVFEHLTFNLKHPILADLAARRAIATAIDTQQLVDRLLLPVDPNAQVLEQAGWALGGDGVYARNGKRLELRYTTFTGDPLRKAEGELLQAQLAEAGIRLRIANRPISTYFESVFDGNFDIADFAWLGNLFVLSNCQDVYRSGGSTNVGKFADPTVDALFQQALGELDPTKAADLGNQIDQQLWAQLPSIPLYQPPRVLAWRQDLLNVGHNPSVEGPFWNAGTWGFARP